MMAASDGYDFVPIPDEVHREVRECAQFGRRTDGALSLILELEYELVEPVHVGSGHWTVNGQTAVRMAARSGDRAVIPGSSMRGLMRARHEAMTKSCCPSRAPRDAKLGGKRYPSRSYPGYDVKFSESISQHEIFSKCQGSLRCAACALFGLASGRSRISVRDFLAPGSTRLEIAKMPERFSPRPHHLGRFTENHNQRRLDVTALDGRKVYLGSRARGKGGWQAVEVIPKGTRVIGSVGCNNVTFAEFGALLSVVGFFPWSRSLRIGSAKAYRFGELKVANLRLSPHPAVSVPHDVDELLSAARQAFVESADYYEDGERRLVLLSGGEWR